MSIAILKTFREGDRALKRGIVDSSGKVTTFRPHREGREVRYRGKLADGKIGVGHIFRGDVDHAHARVKTVDGSGCQDDFCDRVRQQLPAQVHVHILQDLPIKDIFGDLSGQVYSTGAPTPHCPDLIAQGIDPTTIPCQFHPTNSPPPLIFDLLLDCSPGEIVYGAIIGGAPWFLRWNQDFAMWLLTVQIQHENPTLPGEYYWTTEFFYREGNPAFYPNIPGVSPLGNYTPAFSYVMMSNPLGLGEGMFKLGPEFAVPAWTGATVT